MATHSEPVQESALRWGSIVALLESRGLAEEEYSPYLSANERAKYSGISHPRRKSCWLAGRLAAKYLFLSRLEMAQSIQSQERKPDLITLTSAVLNHFSPWMYQKVEVLPNSETPNPHPGFIWCGKKRAESISLSHSGDMSCACLTFGSAATIDIESAAPRVSAFYRNSFTQSEKRWVSDGAGDDQTRSNWLYTLLWTMKESAAKLKRLHQASVWTLSRIEIEGLPNFNHVEPPRGNSRIGVDFMLFIARVRELHRVMQVQVAVTGTRDLILTVMNPLSGVAH